MRVTGRTTIEAPQAAVFEAICDPAALLEVIPGCQGLERDGEDYHGRIALRLPAIVGTFDVHVRLVDAVTPSAGTLRGRLEGRIGTIDGSATFRLNDDDGVTVIDYDGSALVSGPLARLDSRLLEGLAESLISEGLSRLGRRLAAQAAVPA